MIYVPSGKLTVCYWKWPFIVSFPIKNDDFPIENGEPLSRFGKEHQRRLRGASLQRTPGLSSLDGKPYMDPMGYPLVNCYITMERSTMLLMGKSTNWWFFSWSPRHGYGEKYLWKYQLLSGLFTSILTQLFWCEQKGYKVLTHTHFRLIWLNYVEFYWHQLDVTVEDG